MAVVAAMGVRRGVGGIGRRRVGRRVSARGSMGVSSGGGPVDAAGVRVQVQPSHGVGRRGVRVPAMVAAEAGQQQDQHRNGGGQQVDQVIPVKPLRTHGRLPSFRRPDRSRPDRSDLRASQRRPAAAVTGGPPWTRLAIDKPRHGNEPGVVSPPL